jgi:hypothetical protein
MAPPLADHNTPLWVKSGLPRTQPEGPLIAHGVIVPAGQISDLPVKSILRKYSSFSPPQITPTSQPSRPGRGALAIVTNVGRDAVDAAVSGACRVRRAGFGP